MTSGTWDSVADEHGVLLRREILALGYSDKVLTGALRNKELHRIRQGAYMPRRRWAELSQTQRHLARARAVVRQAKTQVALSHVTAAVLHGAPVPSTSLEDVHLTRRDRRGGRREAGICQHRSLLSDDDVQVVDGLLVTTPTRTALDMTTVVDLDSSLPVLDHFLHTHQTTHASLTERLAVMQRWPHSLATDLAIRLSDGRRENLAESRVCLLIWRAGLPKPIPQYNVYDENGKLIGRVDFAWPELGVFLEFDGKVKYERFLRDGESVVDAVLREKAREERICRRTGWRCLRLVWADLERPARTAALIRRVLNGGPVYS